MMKIFSNEKIFTVDKLHNSRNDCWLARGREEVHGIGYTEHPASCPAK